MRIAVVGAAGRTGRLVTAEALRRGHRVQALVRNPAAIDSAQDGLEVRKADVLVPGSLVGAFEGIDAVISTLGIGSSRQPTEVYSTGISNVLTAMQAAGVSRIAVVSAAPVGPQEDHTGLVNRIVMSLLWKAFGASYADMRRMEVVLAAGTADWVSVRPPRLIDKAPTGAYRLGTKPPAKARMLRYGDLASALLDVLDDVEIQRKAVYVSN